MERPDLVRAGAGALVPVSPEPTELLQLSGVIAALGHRRAQALTPRVREAVSALLNADSVACRSVELPC
jgi:hypothetical protein